MNAVSRFLLAAIASSFFAGPAHAQEIADGTCGPLSGIPIGTPMAQRSFGPAPAEAFAQAGAAMAGPTFNLEFLDVTLANGVGFDDPIVGATRRATAQAVFDYIASELPQAGSADIQFQESEVDGSGFLGQAQPFANPLLVACQVAYPVTHIMTGIDPDPALPDGIITIDFGYSYNDGLGTVGPSEFDLFTLILHEASHAIGFVSTLTSDVLGNGPLGMNPDIRIEGFDLFVEDALGNPMIACPDGTFLGTGGAGGDLEGQPSLRFAGAAATAAWVGLGNTGLPPLYTPASFAPGSSVTHWDTNDPNVPSNAVMVHLIPFATENRQWSVLELGALEDMGYFDVVAAVPGLSGLGLGLLVVALLGGAARGVRATGRATPTR